jgi:hypothetical protein
MMSVMVNMAKDTIRLVSWASPFLFLLCLAGIKKQAVKTANLLAYYCLMVFFVYMLIGGSAFTFPRFQVPFLPALSIIAAAAFYDFNFKLDKKIIVSLILITAALIVYDLILVKDPILLFNFTLKESMVSNNPPLQATYMALLVQYGLWILPVFVVYFSFPYLGVIANRIELALLVLLLSSCLSIDFIQAFSKYSTNYCYGATGLNEAAGFLKGKVKVDDTLVTYPDIKFGAGNNSPFLGGEIFSSAEKMINYIDKTNSAAIIYGITSNTIEQLKNIFGSKLVQDYLIGGYDRFDFGSYTVWIRKDINDKHPANP